MRRSALVPPLLFSVWPVIALAARNPRGFDRITELGPPLAVALLVAVAAWVIVARLAANQNTRALASVTLVASWWGFTSVVDPLRAVGVLPTAVAPWVVTAGLLAFTWALARRWPDTPDRLRQILLLSGSLLVALTGIQLVVHRVHMPVPQTTGLSLPIPDTRRNTIKPDIHIIVLDAYTGSRSLLANYGFDNQPFLTALRQRGFTIPERFHANYPGTATTVAALLNWDYVQSFATDLDTTSWDRSQLEPYVEESRTWRFFAHAGYAITYVPGAFTGRNRYATDRLTFTSSAFQEAWLAMTPLRSIRWIVPAHGLASHGSAASDMEAARHNARFQFIAERARASSPRLSFAHFLLPHDPYVYHADCSHRKPPLTPWLDRSTPEEVDRQAYLDQLSCTNAKVLELVDTLTEEGMDSPVILLLSDHGRSSMRFGVLPLESAGESDVVERLDAFGAFLVPPEAREAFGRVGSPVTAMRALMREVFELPLPPLEDLAYWAEHRRPFRFVQVSPE